MDRKWNFGVVRVLLQRDHKFSLDLVFDEVCVYYIIYEGWWMVVMKAEPKREKRMGFDEISCMKECIFVFKGLSWSLEKLGGVLEGGRNSKEV